MSKIIKVLFFTIISFITQLSFAANVFIPTLDFTSRIHQSGDVETRLQLQMAYDGGYKYQAKLFFQVYNTDLERSDPPELVFEGAQGTIKHVFNFVDITYWTGFYGILGEGRHYKGYLYHWETGFDYNGYLPILGTGFVFSAGLNESLVSQLFVYRRYGTTFFNSIDALLGVDKDPFLFNLFLGTSESDPSSRGIDLGYRIGTQFIYFGQDVEFYLTVGNPSLEFGKSVDFDDFYFLLEQWIKMNNWNLILSAFSRPSVHYNYEDRAYIDTDESNDLDFNFDINYEPEARYFSVGSELNFQTNSTESLGVFVSPYVKIFTSGLIFKVKLDVNIISERETFYGNKEWVTGYVNLQASF